MKKELFNADVNKIVHLLRIIQFVDIPIKFATKSWEMNEYLKSEYLSI